ncbi:protoporphyrinogen oxidase [Heyndrickxia ginsengihumi]|uniref:protoporphyrinogen oxidase n=1 Tax=Heyndrickxia ginsengihumi TaxID=363870 RepID=UPI00203C2505|nr:protoporphyrinogen oxidase [Heyndrickxia ginsengihumi]MCM3023612.1 protoporphyrinogen oxidase [Heyndrickxia ginsengihumi]
MADIHRKVVVLGGGITGLTAAYYLQQYIEKNKLPVELILLERNSRLGGKIQTIRRNGFIIDKGPDSFLARKKSALRLIKDIGLQSELISNAAGASYIIANQRLHPIPKGSIMGIPAQISSLLTTNLISVSGKIRALCDLILPRKKIDKDQSVGDFIRYRLGEEVLENLVEPLLSGVYAGNIDRLSLLTTLPQLYQAEQKYRSLMLGMKRIFHEHAQNDSRPTNKSGAFFTLANGLETLVEALEEKIHKESIMKSVTVDKIEKSTGKHQYKIKLTNGTIVNTDFIISALPHYALPHIFSTYNIFDSLKNMPSTSVATIAMAFPEEAIVKDIDGSGFVVSRNSDYTITACTWTHKKWPHTVPKGKALLRCYIGRLGDEAAIDLSDDQIENIVLGDLKRIMSISSKPEFTIVTRWKYAMPQYTVGHLERVDKIIKEAQQELPGIFFIGSSFEGIGIPDCIRQGEEAVKNIVQYI